MPSDPVGRSFIGLRMAAVLIPVDSVKMLAAMSSFAALAAFFAVNVLLLVLRCRLPRHERPFRVPFMLFGVPVPPRRRVACIVEGRKATQSPQKLPPTKVRI
jgi:amino acid transporter